MLRTCQDKIFPFENFYILQKRNVKAAKKTTALSVLSVYISGETPIMIVSISFTEAVKPAVRVRKRSCPRYQDFQKSKLVRQPAETTV